MIYIDLIQNFVAIVAEFYFLFWLLRKIVNEDSKLHRYLFNYTEVAKLQAEVERLKQMVKSITGGLDEAIESNQYLGKELDKARETIDEINNRTVSFLECGPYETGVEALRLAQEIYKLALQEG